MTTSFWGSAFNMSSMRLMSSFLVGTQSWPRKILPSDWIATLTCFWPSGYFSGLEVSGSSTGMPDCSRGVTTMKMISSTRQTSTSGVTLMSDWTEPALSTFGPPCSLACRRADCIASSVLLDEEVDQLRRGVRHLDLEALDLIQEVV